MAARVWFMERLPLSSIALTYGLAGCTPDFSAPADNGTPPRRDCAANQRLSMDHSANRIFISYRRDDAAGYAGRLEEALEKRLGPSSVFRDVLDIPPGDDFVTAIRARLAGARAVLVL